MPKAVRFEIPVWVEEAKIADYISNNMHEYSDALDKSASEHDDRAEVDEIIVTNVELEEDSVFIYYDVEFSAYYGCRDMNYSDTDEREICGTRKGRVFTFEKYIPPPKRTTFEEF